MLMVEVDLISRDRAWIWRSASGNDVIGRGNSHSRTLGDHLLEYAVLDMAFEADT